MDATGRMVHAALHGLTTYYCSRIFASWLLVRSKFALRICTVLAVEPCSLFYVSTLTNDQGVSLSRFSGDSRARRSPLTTGLTPIVYGQGGW